MGPDERDSQPVQLFIQNEDGTRTLVGEAETLTVHPVSPLESIQVEVALRPSEETETEASTPEAPAAPEALPSLEEVMQAVEPVNPMQKLLDSFEDIEEGSLYSSDVQSAIDLIAHAENMQQALQILHENRNRMDFRHLLFRRVDEESQHLDRFMQELQRVPSLPSPDVDFI